MSELRELYQEVILDHNRAPRNFGKLHDSTHHCEGYNPLCGDKLEIYVKVEDGHISDIAFEGQGCAISKASASLMTEALKGLPVAEAMALFERVHDMLTGEHGEEVDLEAMDKLAALSGVAEFPVRVKCATLAWHTMKNAIKDKSAPASTE